MYLIIGITEETNDLCYSLKFLDQDLIQDVKSGSIRMISLHGHKPRELYFPEDVDTYDWKYIV